MLYRPHLFTPNTLFPSRCFAEADYEATEGRHILVSLKAYLVNHSCDYVNQISDARLAKGLRRARIFVEHGYAQHDVIYDVAQALEGEDGRDADFLTTLDLSHADDSHIEVDEVPTITMARLVFDFVSLGCPEIRPGRKH